MRLCSRRLACAVELVRGRQTFRRSWLSRIDVRRDQRHDAVGWWALWPWLPPNWNVNRPANKQVARSPYLGPGNSCVVTFEASGRKLVAGSTWFERDHRSAEEYFDSTRPLGAACDSVFRFRKADLPLGPHRVALTYIGASKMVNSRTLTLNYPGPGPYAPVQQ